MIKTAKTRNIFKGGALLAGLMLVWTVAIGQEDSQKIEVVGSRFKVTTADGRILSQADLVGATLSLRDASGNRLAFRIDAVEPDPMDPSGRSSYINS